MKEQNMPIEEGRYVRSNEMISAKYHSTILENQIISIALTRIEGNLSDASQTLTARFYPGELARLVSDPTHISRDLKAVAKSITGHTMVIEDSKGNFQAFSVIPNAEYQDGVFSITFNHVLKKHIYKLTSNFTSFELSTMIKFKHNPSFRIYELLKKEMYRSRLNQDSGCVNIEFDIFEFRFSIGIANVDNSFVQNKMKNMTTINWEELYLELTTHGNRSEYKYVAIDNLRRECLDVAKKELQEISDVRFDYELIRLGRSVKRILFHAYPNKVKKTAADYERTRYLEMISQPRQTEFPLDYPQKNREIYDKYVGHNRLSKEDIDVLFKYSIASEDIDKAIEYADKNSNTINNYMGYLVDTLKNRYFEDSQIETLCGSADLADTINHPSEDTKRKVWAHLKEMPDFKDFLRDMELFEKISLYELDEILTPFEACDKYFSWKKERRIL